VGEIAETDDASNDATWSVLDDLENSVGDVAVRRFRADHLAPSWPNRIRPTVDPDSPAEIGEGVIEAAVAAAREQ
jgi:hypothetical protein